MRVDPLTALAMWDTWQAQVRAALPAFAASPWYVEQDRQSPAEVDAVVATLGDPGDRAGMIRDVPHGARPFPTRHGFVTRSWVDGQIEIAFLRRALPAGVDLAALDVLDIGAGYGRLAVQLAPFVRSYTCVDPVAVSVEVCRTYTQQYAPSVRVLDVAGLRAAGPTLRPTLALNVHSWNECTAAQIGGWLDLLDDLGVPLLFTVSHGQNAGVCPSGVTASGTGVETSYRAWDSDATHSYKPRLLARYALLAEDSIGISQHPHALWRRRAG